MGNGKEWCQYNINIDHHPYGRYPKLGAIICFAGQLVVALNTVTYATVEEIYFRSYSYFQL